MAGAEFLDLGRGNANQPGLVDRAGLPTGDSPIEAPHTWAMRMGEMSATYRGLVEAMSDALADVVAALPACHAMREAAGIDRAHQAGELRREVTHLKVFLFVHGVTWAAERGPGGEPGLAFLGLRAL